MQRCFIKPTAETEHMTVLQNVELVSANENKLEFLCHL